MVNETASLRSLFAQALPELYAFAYQVCGDREDARRFVVDLAERLKAQEIEPAALREHDSLRELLIGMLARSMEESLGRKADQSFQILDNILRSDITRPIDFDAEGIDGDPDRIPILLWELKRTCLTAVLGCLPPSVRLSFILTDLLGYSPGDAAGLLNIRESAYRVRLTRARKRVEDYLTPRCQHVDRNNPCNCEGRLGIALDAKFVVAPPHTLDITEREFDSDPDFRDMAMLYRRLPRVVMTDEERAELLAVLD